jgi:hypothetical protein
MSTEDEANKPGNLMNEPVMPIENLLPPFRRGDDSPLGRHFAELDAKAETDMSERRVATPSLADGASRQPE